MKNVSPLPKKARTEAVSIKDDSYQIVLTFNSNAELIDIAHPSNFNMKLVDDHVAIASQFLTEQVAGAEPAQA